MCREGGDAWRRIKCLWRTVRLVVLKVCSLDQQFPGNWLETQILQPHPDLLNQVLLMGSLSQQAWQVFLMPARVREPHSRRCSAHPPDGRAVRALALVNLSRSWPRGCCLPRGVRWVVLRTGTIFVRSYWNDTSLAFSEMSALALGKREESGTGPVEAKRQPGEKGV